MDGPGLWAWMCRALALAAVFSIGPEVCLGAAFSG
jgi:hypothetical protein